MMQQLIKITTNEQGSKVVSARELYDFLGYDKSQWSRWYKKNIEENAFAIENQDWIGFDTMSNGNETKDFALSIDFSKRLSQMARTAKGEEIRNYFIECEKLVQSPKELTRKELALMVIQVEEEKEQLQLQVENLNTALDSLVEWVSIIKVATKNRINETTINWRLLKRKSDEMGYAIKKAASPRYGYQNLYHINAFKACYPQFDYNFSFD